MLRALPFALVPLALAAAFAGCDCSNKAGNGKGDAGRRDGSVVHRDDGGNIIIVIDDDGGTTGGPDGSPAVAIPPGHFKDPGNTLDGVNQDDAGYLILDHNEVSLHFAWLANPDSPGTVSKIDTTTGKEVGRYLAVIPIDGLGQANGLTYNNANKTGASHASSRTAVDLNGDVWLANRAFGTQGSVTKIANAEADCVERNGIPGIQTSRDKNGNGVIDADEIIMPADPTDPKQYDECVLFTTPIGTHDQPTVPRAIAIDSGMEGAPGNIWVGLWCGMSGPDYPVQAVLPCHNDYNSAGAFVKLSPTTGEFLDITPGHKSLAVPLRPYGAAVDAQNRVWYSHSGVTSAIGIDGDTGTIIGPYLAPNNWGGYGMSVQVTKDGKTRVWVANIGATFKISRFNVDTGDWMQIDFQSQLTASGEVFGQARGIAVDDTGTVWTSSYIDDGAAAVSDCGTGVVELIGINSDTGQVRRFPNGKAVINLSQHFADLGQPAPCIGLGVGMDNSNHVWVASSNGYAMGVDRTTGEVNMRSPDVGDLYTYSDFTGYTLRTFTAPTGGFKTIFTGCAPEATTHWLQLVWDADVPSTTKLKFTVRTGASKLDFNQPGLKSGPWEISPADLVAASVPDGQYMQVLVDFISLDKISTPRLKSLTAIYSCEGGIN